MLGFEPHVIAIIVLAALVFSIMGGATGLGTALAMIPVMTFVLGIREAVPMITVAVTMQSASRVWFNRKEIDTGVARWFAIGALPAAVFGAVAFANAPADFLARGLGLFLVLILVYRRTQRYLPARAKFRMSKRGFLAVGIGQGFLSALFGGAGPFGASFYLSYGLVRNAFVGTMALGMASINLVKLSVYGSYTLLDQNTATLALGIGAIMVFGAYIGGILIRHISDRVFTLGVELVIFGAAVALLLRS